MLKNMNRNILLAVAIALLLSACGKKTQENTVSRRDITEYLFATGILEPESQYNLTAQNDGYLIALGLEEGDLVTQGGRNEHFHAAFRGKLAVGNIHGMILGEVESEYHATIRQVQGKLGGGDTLVGPEFKHTRGIGSPHQCRQSRSLD